MSDNHSASNAVGNDYHKARKYAGNIQKLRQFTYLNITSDKPSSFIKRIILGLICIVPSHWLIKYQDKKIKRYKYYDSQYITRWRMPSLPDNVVNKNVFEDSVLLDFEGLKLCAPKNYDNYLRLVYGDYLTPQKDNASLRHGVQACSNVSQSLDAVVESMIEH